MPRSEISYFVDLNFKHDYKCIFVKLNPPPIQRNDGQLGFKDAV